MHIIDNHCLLKCVRNISGEFYPSKIAKIFFCWPVPKHLIVAGYPENWQMELFITYARGNFIGISGTRTGPIYYGIDII